MSPRPPKFGPFAVLAWRKGTATEDSDCPACGQFISKGKPVLEDDYRQDVHPACAQQIKAQA
jgi:hypothetical protein